MTVWQRPALVVYAAALAAALVDLVALSVPGGVGSALLWLPTTVGLLAWRHLGARALPWLLIGLLLGRGVLVLAVGTLPPSFMLIDTAVELLVVGLLAPWLRWRLPRAGWSAAEASRLLLLRLLAHDLEPATALIRRVRGRWRQQAWGLAPHEPRIWAT